MLRENAHRECLDEREVRASDRSKAAQLFGEAIATFSDEQDDGLREEDVGLSMLSELTPCNSMLSEVVLALSRICELIPVVGSREISSDQQHLLIC